MATFVLVHGAFGGAHTFRRVRPLLQTHAHDVFTPALTGIGERWHLSSPQVNFETHVQDVVNVLEYWDLREIVLLGYSYGGRVVTGTLPRVAERIAHLVYLDTMLPRLGSNVSPLARGLDSGALGADWLVTPNPMASDYYDDTEAADFYAPRRTPQPVRTIVDPIVLDRELESYPFTRTYIKATGEPRPTEGGPAWDAADRVSASPSWRYYEIATNHAIPENRPAELARVLFELVGNGR